MPLHKSTRAPRLDPTMISAPLGDFRHTMHIGRGGDAFGDTSFLSTLGPSKPSPDAGNQEAAPDSDLHQVTENHSDLYTDAPGSPQNNELQHSESVSSFDLDLDLGPSMLGDVLGIMDGMGLDSNEEDVFSPKSGSSSVKGATEVSANMQNGQNLVGLDGNQVGDGRIPDANGIKPKGLRPKVRFSDKREEIIRQASEEEEGQAFDFQEEDQLACRSPTVGESDKEVEEVSTEFTNHKADLPPSPASSHSSEYEGVTSLDRRRVESCHSDSDSEEEEEEEEEEEGGRGYTFEDEFDDEIGL